MQLTHEFTVPVGLEQTWAAFNDIEGVAECFPGATITSVEGDTFKGTVKVKLGPIQMVYNGTGSFTEKDKAARRMVVVAKGKDKRGNGTAGADVVATMAADGGATRVEVTTDLAITGKPAQFGRGVIQDVSDKLLGQFVANLEQRLGATQDAAPAPVEEDADSGPASVPTGAAAAPDAGAPGSDPDSGPASAPRPGATAAPPAPAPSPRPGPDSSGDALDLGATVLPVLARSYWRQALGAVVVLWVLWRLVGRWRGR